MPAARRGVRVLLGIVLAIVIIVVVAVLALPSLINVNQYHDKIQAELQSKLGRSVSLGPMKLKIFPLALRVDSVQIGEDPSFVTGKPFATAHELDVSLRLLPLLHKDVEVNSIELVRPVVELVRNQQGRWNFASLGHAQAEPQKKSGASNLQIGELKLTDGTVAVTDNQKLAPAGEAKRAMPLLAAKTGATNNRTVYDHIDFAVKNFAPNKNFEFSVAAHMPGAGNQTIALSGNAGPIKQGDATATPIDAKLQMNSVDLAGLQRFLSSEQLRDIGGIATGTIALKNNNGNFAANGNVKLENGRIHGVDLGYPVNADIDMRGDMTAQQFHINKGDVKLGPTPLSVSGDLNARATPIVVDLQVKASDASLSEIARLAAAFGMAFAPGAKVEGKLNADVSAKGAITNPEMNGSVNLSHVNISGAGIKQAVQTPSIQMALTPGAIKANPFTVTTGSARLDAAFILTDYAQPNSRRVDATLKTDQANLEDLLSIAHAYGVPAAEGVSGTGQVALDAHIAGPVKNAAAMQLSGTGALRNASITLPSLSKPLNVRNADLRFAQNTATLQNLNLNVGGTNATGNISVSNFAAPNLQFALNADKVDVAEMQSLMKAAPTSAPKQAQRGGTLIPVADAAATAHASPLETITGGGQVTIGQVLYNQIPIENVRSTVMLDHGIVRLAPVTAELFGGTENGTITVDTRPVQPVITVNTKIAKVDANKLLSATTSLKQRLFGSLNAGGDLGFVNVANGTLASTLNGTLSLNLQNGKLMGIDLLRELGNIGKFGAGGSGFTTISQLAGAFNIRNGVAHTDNLRAAIDGGTLAGVGDINLGNESLNMKATAVLSSAMSKTVGGSGIGGIMNTALANRNGELVIPVLVTGTFSSPHFAPDLEQIAQMKLKNLLPTAANPGGALSGLLGGATGKGGALSGVLGALGGQQQQNGKNAQPPQQQNPAQAIQGILGQFGGTKKKPK